MVDTQLQSNYWYSRFIYWVSQHIVPNTYPSGEKIM